ncbi:hypothetical protein ACQ4PT_028415 [Festuca glaucescens]
MDEQTRASLVSWMDGLTRRFGLAPGTPRRAASYVDRVLSARTLSTTPPSDYEQGLLGAAAVFAAAKYEDGSTVSKLNAADIARYCGFATSREVIRAERDMLAALRYELGGPTTCYTVAGHFTGDNEGEPQDLEIQRVAPDQLAEDSEVGTSLVDDGYLQQLMPSVVAASAVLFAICIVFALFSEFELGLLGAAAVFAAAKYEDGSTVSKLNAVDIARYCGFATSREVIRAEREMLAALLYELGGPTTYYTVAGHLITRYSEGEQDLEIQKLAPQLAEDSEVGTSLVDAGYLLQLMPSAVAASTVFFAICIIFAPFSECISVENLVFQL